jgi:hypothetical protein
LNDPPPSDYGFDQVGVQINTNPEVAEVVGERVQLETDGIGGKGSA